MNYTISLHLTLPICSLHYSRCGAIIVYVVDLCIVIEIYCELYHLPPTLTTYLLTAQLQVWEAIIVSVVDLCIVIEIYCELYHLPPTLTTYLLTAQLQVWEAIIVSVVDLCIVIEIYCELYHLPTPLTAQLQVWGHYCLCC